MRCKSDRDIGIVRQLLIICSHGASGKAHENELTRVAMLSYKLVWCFVLYRVYWLDDD